jgi:hypothetical protein
MLSFQFDSPSRILPCLKLSKRQTWSRRTYQERLHLRRLKLNPRKSGAVITIAKYQECANEQN